MSNLLEVKTESDFLQLIKDRKIQLYEVSKSRYDDSGYRPTLKTKKGRLADADPDNNRDLSELFFLEKWSTGGIGGGSCWDTGEEQDRHYSYTSDDEESEFKISHLILESFPQIPYIQYTGIFVNAQRGQYSVNEYYGNCTNYSYKVISLKEIYDKLVKFKLIQ